MSGPKSSTVQYVPTKEQREATARRGLRDQLRRAQRMAERAQREAASWRTKVPGAAERIALFTVPVVDVNAANPEAALVEARSALDRAERGLKQLLADAAAEDARRRARAHIDAAEIGAVQPDAPAVALPSVGLDDLGSETSVEPAPAAQPPAPPTARVPRADGRVRRVMAILERSTDPVDPATVSGLLERASTASDELRFHSVLQEARRTVEATQTAATRSRREAEEARALLASMGELRSAELDRLRDSLNAVADGNAALDPMASVQVSSAKAAATRHRLVTVLAGLGCELVPGEDERLVGYIDQGGGTASKVLVDDRGMLLTPVSAEALDRDDAIALDERNCDLHRRISAHAADEGVALDLISARRPGEAPVRVEAHPFAADNASGDGRETASVTEERQRRNRKRRQVNERRTESR